MGWKDWLAAAAFVVVLAFAVTTVVFALQHERTHHTTISAKQEQTLQSLCQNSGNGGC